MFYRFAVCHADVYMYIDAYMWIVAVSSIHSNSYVSVMVSVGTNYIGLTLTKTAVLNSGF